MALCSNLAMPYGEIVSSLLPPLDAYAWSYEISAIKPEPKIYQSLIDQLGYQASEVLFIGDTIQHLQILQGRQHLVCLLD